MLFRYQPRPMKYVRLSGVCSLIQTI